MENFVTLADLPFNSSMISFHIGLFKKWDTISIYEHANTLSFYHMDQITLSDKCLNIIVDTKGGKLYHFFVAKFCNF